MTSIGETLRRERLQRKLNFEGISQELKISARLLEAIEDEDFDKLPGGVFTRSFVRQYARYLGLDEEEIASELQRVFEPQPSAFQTPAAPHRQTDIPLPKVEAWETVADKRFQWSKSLPAFAMVVVIMLVCSAIYSWWQRPRRSAVIHEAAPSPVATGTASRQGPPALSASQATAVAPPSAPEAAAQPQNAPPATAPASSPSAPASAAVVRVELTAEEPVWVSVRSDGKYLFSGTIEANQSRTAEGSDAVIVRLGNAGGIHISVNGKPIGPVGPKGQIRTVQLTSGGFQVLPPEAPKPAPPPIDFLDPL